ncbi:MAG: DUF433 domain-containing protein [Patescibacteria group bacterium]
MKKSQSLDLIIADPQICHGKPIIKGTRVMVWQILELLEAGKDKQEIKLAFPNLPPGAIPAVLHYAAERAKGSTYHEFITNDSAKPAQIFA